MKWAVLKKMILNYQHSLKAIISIVLLVALVNIFLDKREYLAQIQWKTFLDYWYFIPILLLMMMINWALEARKWQLLTNNPSFYNAQKIVLIGLLFKQFIPLGVGELSGRVLADNHTDKIEAAGAFMVVGFVQFSVTVLLGSFGLYWLLNHTSYHVDNQLIIAMIIALFLILIVVFLRKKIIGIYHKWFDKLKKVSIGLLLKLIVISAGRYLIFFTQSIIIYFVFNNSLSIMLLAAGISFVFLAKTIVPSFGFLGDLGIRGFSAVLFFGYFEVAPMPVILASLSVWVVNIFIPSFAALFLVRKLSFNSKA